MGQAQPTDVTRPKWSAGCRRRLIGRIQINNHSDYLDGWSMGEKDIISKTRKEVLVGWNVFNCPWQRSTFQRLELDMFIKYQQIDKMYFGL